MNFVRALLLLATGLAACGSDHMMSKSCTDIGCSDGVTIDLGPRAAYGTSATLKVHVCIDSACADMIVSATDCQLQGAGGTTTPPLILMCTPETNLVIVASATTAFGAGSHLVAVAVSDASGTMIFSHSENVATTSTQPNGPDCEPTCHQGKLTTHP